MRRESRRQSPEVTAGDAERLQNDPAFIKAFDETRETIIDALERLVINGTDEQVEVERELCRSLRTLGTVRRTLLKSAAGQKLREADFRPRVVRNDDDG